MLGAIVVHNWQVVRRAIALGLFSPTRVCVYRPSGTADIVHSQMCSDISTFANANNNPGFVDVHSRACTCVQQTFKDREPRGIASQGRKCRLEQESVGGDRFTPASGETPVHQQWHIHTWKHLENTIYLFKTPTLENISIAFDLFNHVIPAIDELIKGKQLKRVSLFWDWTKKDQKFTEYKPSCKFKMVSFFFVLQTLTVVRERLQ